MRFRLIWMGAVLMAPAFPQTTAWRVGEPAPPITVEDRRGAAVQVTAFRQSRVVVLAVAELGALPALEARESSWKQLDPLGAVPLYAASGETGGAQPTMVLIDTGGTVRAVHGGQPLSGSRMKELVSMWQLGKGVFETGCARCHGLDGALDICLDVKPLAGIGRRMTAEEIRERLRMAELNPNQFLIRSQFYKKAEVDAVIAYIRGL